MRAAQAGRQPFRGVLRNHRNDGTPFWNAVTINPVFGDAGEVVSFVGGVREVLLSRGAPAGGGGSV